MRPPRSSSRSRLSKPAELKFRTNAVPSSVFPVNTSDDTASDGATDTAAAAGIVGSGVVEAKYNCRFDVIAMDCGLETSTDLVSY